MGTLYEQGNVLANTNRHSSSGVKRFDIIVFKATEEKDFIKRVIGLPGDHIEYRGDVLYLNGETYSEPYLDEKKKEVTEGLLTYDFDIKTLASTTSEVVPEGHYFVLGDNRRRSDDSRLIGFVSATDIIGKANVVFWPLDEIGIVK